VVAKTDIEAIGYVIMELMNKVAPREEDRAARHLGVLNQALIVTEAFKFMLITPVTDSIQKLQEV
jgi:hypothetical protein